MRSALHRAFLALLVLSASASPALAAEETTSGEEDAIVAGAAGERVSIAHDELVRCAVPGARAQAVSPWLAARWSASIAHRPHVPASVRQASARSRRSFTRVRVRRALRFDPDDD